MSSKNIDAKLRLLMVVSLLFLTSCANSAVDERRIGIAAHEDANYCEAVSHLEKAIALNPKDESARRYMALSNERLEQYPQAKKQFAWLAKNAETASDREAAWTNVKRLRKIAGEIKPRVVLLSEKDCGYSIQFRPDFDKVAKEFKNRADFVIVDIDRPELKPMADSYSQYISERFGAFAVPAFVFECRHGIIQDAVMGQETVDELRESLAKALKHSDEEKEPG